MRSLQTWYVPQKSVDQRHKSLKQSVKMSVYVKNLTAKVLHLLEEFLVFLVSLLVHTD